MSQKFPHMNFPIGEVSISSKMFGLADTGSGLNLVNIDITTSQLQSATLNWCKNLRI